MADNVNSATLLNGSGISFAAKKVMALVNSILTGLAGGLQLYSGVKNLFSDNYGRARKSLEKSRAAENAWYRRNYYNDYLNSSMARAAMKRVEDTLSRNSRQNRAYAAVMGVTPEVSLARNEQNLQVVDNMMTNLASQESARRASVDAQHLQNVNSLNGQQMSLDMNNRSSVDPELIGGLSLIERAIDGVNWGKEEKTPAAE